MPGRLHGARPARQSHGSTGGLQLLVQPHQPALVRRRHARRGVRARGRHGRLRDEDPIHWNEKYELWAVTRYDDLTWLTRHHELFSSAVFKNDPRPAYPDIDLGEHTKQLTEASQGRLRELKAKLGVDAPHSVIDALLADGIHHEIVRRKADLLVTGRGHSIGTFSRLWSHLYAIIRDSPCPVLSV